jgi:hypothetical protein
LKAVRSGGRIQASSADRSDLAATEEEKSGAEVRQFESERPSQLAWDRLGELRTLHPMPTEVLHRPSSTGKAPHLKARFDKVQALLPVLRVEW